MIDERRKQARKDGTIIEDVPPIPCIFCDYMTSIEFDLDLHLYEEHRIELVQLPIGKGNMDFRIQYAIEEGKRVRDTLSNMTSETRNNLGIYKSSKTDTSVRASSDDVAIGTDFMLSHFDEPLFPRTIMTYVLGRQVKVFDRRSLLDQLKRSDYQDCRINAYSSLFQQEESLRVYSDDVKLRVTIIVIDLDPKDLGNSKEKLDVSLQEALKKIKETINGCPTVLDTGNGYHIYQPIKGIILDEIDELKGYISSYDKFYLSNRFLKFAEQYFTECRCDAQHNPTIKSCLIRVPGTLNSKCGKEVRIIHEWDYYKPSIEPIIPSFKKYLVTQQSSINGDSDFQMISSSNNKYVINQNKYAWVDVLLENPLGDYRKFIIRRIVAPYLIVVKRLPYGECVKIINDWLVRCNCVERLRFNAKYTTEKCLKNAKRVGYRPISLEKLQEENHSLYDIVLKRIQNRSL